MMSLAQGRRRQTLCRYDTIYIYTISIIVRRRSRKSPWSRNEDIFFTVPRTLGRNIILKMFVTENNDCGDRARLVLPLILRESKSIITSNHNTVRVITIRVKTNKSAFRIGSLFVWSPEVGCCCDHPFWRTVVIRHLKRDPQTFLNEKYTTK